MRSRSVRLGLFIAFALVAAACVPYFRDSQTLIVEEVGATLTLRWSQAVDEDPTGSVDYYRIEVDGQVLAPVYSPEVSCALSGLTNGQNHLIEVTAFDNVGDWSGILGGGGAALGRLSTNYIAGAVGSGGGSPSCASLTDTDGDRLADVFETNTGVFIDSGDTGTSPTNPDTDNDGLSDGDEVLGSAAGLNLPAFGVSPLRQDLLLEFDWFDDNVDPGTCSAHSHQPNATLISTVRDTYENAPTANPDGSTGINLVADFGQDQPGDGPYTGGNLVPDADGVIAGGVFDTDYTSIRSQHLAPERSGYFHYVLMPHRYNTNSTSSGQAEVSGGRMIVSLYCFGSNNNVATTTVHELGHNLSLRHGGNNTVNYKPNYNSVMNYKYQFPGVDTDCTPPGNGVIDYSDGSRASLDETNLDENLGVCNAVAWDWDEDTVIEPSVSFDINVNSDGDGDGVFGVLTDFDDWDNLDLAAIGPANGAGARIGPPIAITEQPVPIPGN